MIKEMNIGETKLVVDSFPLEGYLIEKLRIGGVYDRKCYRMRGWLKGEARRGFMLRV